MAVSAESVFIYSDCVTCLCLCVCRFGPPTRTEHRLHVENISSRVSWQVSKLRTRAASTIFEVPTLNNGWWVVFIKALLC